MEILLYIEIFLAILSFLFLYQWSSKRNSKQQHLTNWPVLGMMPAALQNSWCLHEFATSILTQTGGTFEFKGPWLSNMDFVCTCDPDNIHHIFNKNHANYVKGPGYRERLEPFGEGILNADQEQWKIQRKLVQAIVKDGRFCKCMDKYFQDKIMNGLIPVLEHSLKKDAVDLHDVFQRFTFDTTSIMVLSHDAKSLTTEFPDYPYEKALDIVSAAALRRHVFPKSIWKLQKWLQIGDEKKLTKAWKDFDDYLGKIIESKEEKIRKRQTQKHISDKSTENEFDFLVQYMEDEQVNGLMNVDNDARKVLRDAAFNLMAAGRDTVSASLSWFFWVVSMHPSVEKKIIEELKENFPGKVEGFFDEQVLDKLVYLQAAMCECLRLYPPAPYQTRTPLKDDILPSGHHIKKDARMFISYYSMARLEKIWGQDCMEYKPERWITSNGEIKHVPSYKFPAFNTGKRSCIGKDVAMIEIKMVTAALFWNFHFDVLPGQDMIPTLSIMLHLKNGLKVKVSKRSM